MSKRSFTIQVHPVIETIVLENLDKNTACEEVMDMYASITAKKYQFDKKKLLDSIEHAVPFTSVGSSGVYQRSFKLTWKVVYSLGQSRTTEKNKVIDPLFF